MGYGEQVGTVDEQRAILVRKLVLVAHGRLQGEGLRQGRVPRLEPVIVDAHHVQFDGLGSNHILRDGAHQDAQPRQLGMEIALQVTGAGSVGAATAAVAAVVGVRGGLRGMVRMVWTALPMPVLLMLPMLVDDEVVLLLRVAQVPQVLSRPIC